MRKNKLDILGLEPVSPYEDNLAVRDPFAAVYSTLSKAEKEMVDTGRFHILAARAQQVKASIMAQFMQNITGDLTETFASAVAEIDSIIAAADLLAPTSTNKYVSAFAHRRKQKLAKNLESLEGIFADHAITEAGRSVYPQNDDNEQMSRARRAWNALLGR